MIILPRRGVNQSQDEYQFNHRENIKGCRRNMVGSLPRGMPKVVDYWQTGAQATNEMVTQDRHEVLSRFGRREGVIPTSCV